MPLELNLEALRLQRDRVRGREISRKWRERSEVETRLSGIYIDISYKIAGFSLKIYLFKVKRHFAHQPS